MIIIKDTHTEIEDTEWNDDYGPRLRTTRTRQAISPVRGGRSTQQDVSTIRGKHTAVVGERRCCVIECGPDSSSSNTTTAARSS